MDGDKIIREAKEEFESFKKEHNLKAGYDELNKHFHVSDHLVRDGYAPGELSRNICVRASNFIMGWANYLHGLLMPNPHHLISVNESKMLSDVDKKEVTDLISSIMSHNSKELVVHLKNNPADDAKMIDEFLEVWKNDLFPRVEKIMVKINEGWNKK